MGAAARPLSPSSASCVAVVAVSVWTPLRRSAHRRSAGSPGRTSPVLAPVPIVTALVALVEWRALNDRVARPRRSSGAVGLFVMSYLGIAISLFPMIVPHHFTLWQAASSRSTQAFLLVGTLFLLPVDPALHRPGRTGCSAARCAPTSAIIEAWSPRRAAVGEAQGTGEGSLSRKSRHPAARRRRRRRQSRPLGDALERLSCRARVSSRPTRRSRSTAAAPGGSGSASSASPTPIGRSGSRRRARGSTGSSRREIERAGFSGRLDRVAFFGFSQGRDPVARRARRRPLAGRRRGRRLRTACATAPGRSPPSGRRFCSSTASATR